MRDICHSQSVSHREQLQVGFDGNKIRIRQATRGMKSEVQSTITQHWQREISRSRSSPEFRQLKLARRPTITYYGFAGAGMSFLLDEAGGDGTGPHRTVEGHIFRSPRRLSMSLYLRGSAEHKQRHLPAMVRYE